MSYHKHCTLLLTVPLLLAPAHASPAQANTPSVVNITNIRAMQSYYTMDIQKIPAGTGSGFIWDQKGEYV